MEKLEKLIEFLENRLEKVNKEMKEAREQNKMDDYYFLFGVTNGIDTAILQARLMREGLDKAE